MHTGGWSQCEGHDFSLILMYRLIFSGNQNVGLRGAEMETMNRQGSSVLNCISSWSAMESPWPHEALWSFPAWAVSPTSSQTEGHWWSGGTSLQGMSSPLSAQGADVPLTASKREFLQHPISRWLSLLGISLNGNEKGWEKETTEWHKRDVIILGSQAVISPAEPLPSFW